MRDIEDLQDTAMDTFQPRYGCSHPTQHMPAKQRCTGVEACSRALGALDNAARLAQTCSTGVLPMLKAHTLVALRLCCAHVVAMQASCIASDE